ncbi:MAG TPA: hypothetical protein VLW25_02115 [Bryobacteraceae bacterium]|nr:hypothetical protein [Bryobacteraceae bacterium]
MLDWWEKREVERKLAQELSYAQEKFRQANVTLRDLTGFSPSGIPAPDSNLPIEQAHRTCVHARDQWIAALDRWTNFVKYGTIPEDSTSGEQASAS